jgi:hypothetical protein
MSGTDHFKQNDQRPYFRVILRDNDGVKIDLNAADVSSVVFTMRAENQTTPVVDEQPVTILQTGTGGTAVDMGLCEYRWAPGDLATPGEYLAEFTVTYTGGEQYTLPNKDYNHIRVWDDLS